MTPNLATTQLFKQLKKLNRELAERVVLIRSEVAKWLPLVVQVFPHYPSHGVDHSDRIIGQLSNLLFKAGKPQIKFSAAEVYCLLCSAYLHDIGMVVSPRDTANILSSTEWSTFVSSGGRGSQPYAQYQELHEKAFKTKSDRDAFLADSALRLLIAEFVRRDHHFRGKTTLNLHPFLKTLVDHDDALAFNTIADIGVAHGLSDTELSDASRFPERRLVLGHEVNVRFLARLLRIGDLLDMDTNRADPMTARGVAPLPASAEPHWRQYSTKAHELIAPDSIQFRFECNDQETHRILRDWFDWLELEVRNTGLEQMHSERHTGWIAPRCIVARSASDETSPKSASTIFIEPAKGAKYQFHNWKLILDQELVLDRLIYDVYASPSVFVRELIQNSLDATRCQMYADFSKHNPATPLPTSPTRFDAKLREEYPISLALTTEEVQSVPDSPVERKCVFQIEDYGTGMNEHIITNYLLQVGRSYYKSDEFKEHYRFPPTSRFGIGFLSVFGVSNDITVETAQLDPKTGTSHGLRLRLRGPRNYLLTETCEPFTDRRPERRCGTRIRIVLNEWPTDQSLGDLVEQWCVATEVPIHVTEHGNVKTVHAPPLVDQTVLSSSRVDPEGRFKLRVFDLCEQGCEGQLAIVAYEDTNGEGWCDCWSHEVGLDGDRIDRSPERPGSFAALHGVRIFDDAPLQQIYRYRWTQRIDVRSPSATVPLTREAGPSDGIFHPPTDALLIAQSAVRERARQEVEQHLQHSSRAKGSAGAYYTGEVLSYAPVHHEWRRNFPGTVPVWEDGKPIVMSAADVLATNELTLAVWSRVRSGGAPAMKAHPRDVRSGRIIGAGDVPPFLRDELQDKIFHMHLKKVSTIDDLWLFDFSSLDSESNVLRIFPDCSWFVVERLGCDVPVVQFEQWAIGRKSLLVFAGKHPLVEWLATLLAASETDPLLVKPETAFACWHIVGSRPSQTQEMIRRWRESPEIPDNLKPPFESFRFDRPLWGYRTL